MNDPRKNDDLALRTAADGSKATEINPALLAGHSLAPFEADQNILDTRTAIEPAPPPPVPQRTVDIIAGDLTEFAREASMGLVSDDRASLKRTGTSASITVELSGGTDGWAAALSIDDNGTTASDISFPMSDMKMRAKVFEHLIWSGLTVSDEKATTGAPIVLPLTKSFVLGMTHSGTAPTRIAAGTVELFPLETEIQTYVTIVYGYDLDAETGLVIPLDLSKVKLGELRQWLTNHGNSGPVSTSRTAIVAMLDLSLTSPKDDFAPKGPSPLGPANFGRAYPLLGLWSSRPLETAAAVLDIIRPSISPALGMSRDGAMGSGLFTDVNIKLRSVWDDISVLNPAIKYAMEVLTSNPTIFFLESIPSPRWNSIFAHYSLDTARSRVTVVSPRVGQRTNTSDRKEWDVSSGSYVPRPVLKVERQGMFDNVHVAPVMDYKGVDAYMAPLCHMDCLHIHWRWGAVYDEKPLSGWSGGKPYQKEGAPMIPENQTLFISTSGPHITYAPSAEAVPGQAWQIFMHHGTGYVTSLTIPGNSVRLLDAVQLADLPSWNGFYYHNRMLETGGESRADDIPRLMESGFGPLEVM